MTDFAPTQNTVWFKVYTPAGFQASVTLAFTDAIPSAADVERKLIAAGYTPTLPGLEPGQDKEVIATVIRRHTNNDKHLIDFYTAWSAGGKFGIFKWAHMYIDDAEDIAEFERRSGLKYDALPVMEADAALNRIYGKRHRCEIDVVRSFEIVKTLKGKDSTGKDEYKYEYFGAAPALEPPNPYLDEANQQRILDALKAHGLDKNGNYQYVLDNIILRKLKKISDAHPDLTVSQFIDRLPALALQLQPATPKTAPQPPPHAKGESASPEAPFRGDSSPTPPAGE